MKPEQKLVSNLNLLVKFLVHSTLAGGGKKNLKAIEDKI